MNIPRPYPKERKLAAIEEMKQIRETARLRVKELHESLPNTNENRRRLIEQKTKIMDEMNVQLRQKQDEIRAADIELLNIKRQLGI